MWVLPIYGQNSKPAAGAEIFGPFISLRQNFIFFSSRTIRNRFCQVRMIWRGLEKISQIMVLSHEFRGRSSHAPTQTGFCTHPKNIFPEFFFFFRGTNCCRSAVYPEPEWPGTPGTKREGHMGLISHIYFNFGSAKFSQKFRFWSTQQLKNTPKSSKIAPFQVLFSFFFRFF